MMKVIEKSHRLPKSFYSGFTICAFTANIKDGVNLFNDLNIVNNFTKKLIDICYRTNVDIHIYMFMPNHLHIILQGNQDGSNLLHSMNLFKQKTGFWLYKNKFKARWQKDYYDHIIRDEKDLENQILYVLNNPVRKNIVDDWREYPFKGSTVHDLDLWKI